MTKNLDQEGILGTGGEDEEDLSSNAKVQRGIQVEEKEERLLRIYTRTINISKTK